MKHCNNHLKPLNNMKEIQQNEREAWMDTNGHYIWVHFSSLWQIAWIKAVFAQNALDRDVTIILLVEEFHIVIFEF